MTEQKPKPLAEMSSKEIREMIEQKKDSHTCRHR